MPEIRAIDYEHSGLPSYGLDGADLYRRSYVLRQGRRPHVQRGPWRLLGTLAPAAVGQIWAAPLGFRASIAETEAERAGLLVPYVDHTGTPQHRDRSA